MKQTRLTLRQKILVAGTLFGMFFGAGNLIFPVHLGQIAGYNVVPAIIGFIITVQCRQCTLIICFLIVIIFYINSRNII